jgi:hypothetical protein
VRIIYRPNHPAAPYAIVAEGNMVVSTHRTLKEAQAALALAESGYGYRLTRWPA